MSSISSIQNSAIQAMVSQSSAPGGIAGAGNTSNLNPSTAADSGSGDFGTQLMDVLKQVNETQQQAASKQTDFMTGRHDVDYHDLMISMEKASMAMQLTVSVRNKILEAYQSISQMQV